MRQENLLEIFESIPSAVNQDAHLVHRGRFTHALLKISIDTATYLMEIRGGKITQLTREMPLFQTADLSIRANAQAWAALWEKFPRPGSHDIFALHKRGAMAIEGNSHLLFSNLQYIKDVLSTPRRFHGA
ncbi:hypothetical protein [Diaphorobacter ruginosibacter]|uniref:hypothetical protein n=1 Tax=Diaphorobacter ruginosibacter TaxID=1715720 RepID=UPI00333F1E54